MDRADLREAPATGREARHVARLVSDAVGGPPALRHDRTHALIRKGQSFVLWHRGQPVGAVVGHPDGRTWVMDALGIAPSRRGTGLGTDLVMLLRQQLGGAALVAETDEQAVGFYRRCGFAVTPVESTWPGARRYRCTLPGLGLPIGLAQQTAV